MNVKKILAGAVASVMALSTMAVVANADAPYTATLGFADTSFATQDWESTVSVTGDGTFTVTSNFAPWTDEETGDETPALANGLDVFVVDIAALAGDKGCGKSAEAYADCETSADKMALAKSVGLNVTDVKVTMTMSDDSTADLPVDNSKIIFGDIEGKDVFRIEIFNDYGDTSKDAPVDETLVKDVTKVEVTFTISGIDDNSSSGSTGSTGSEGDGEGEGNGNTSTPTEDKNTPDTGVEGVAVVAGLAIVAAGAVVVAKKRK